MPEASREINVKCNRALNHQGKERVITHFTEYFKSRRLSARTQLSLVLLLSLTLSDLKVALAFPSFNKRKDTCVCGQIKYDL
jgi:hypothetical protein